MEFFHHLLDYVSADTIVKGGYVLMAFIIFAETGLLTGFFLPGDSMLVTAGLFAAQGHLNIWWLNALLIVCAIAGNATGYAIGRRAGQTLFQRKSSRLFKREHLLRTQAFYDKHGGKTIALACFVPIVRTFAPTVAGVAQMPFRRFIFYNVLGAILWVTSMTGLGFVLGRTVPNMGDHIDKLILIVVVLSVSPLVYKFIRSRLGSPKSTVHTPEDTSV